MRFSALLVPLALVTLIAGGSDQAQAHDPSAHGFQLVMFERTFPAPDFSLPELAGKTAQLSAYRGQYVLLNFWATWCPPCLEEMPSMDVVHRRYRERGFTVLAVSSDEQGAEVVVDFIDKLGVEFPILLDADRRVSDIYGARNLPVTFLIDREGQVIAAAQGARDWSSEQALSTLDEIIATQ